MAVFPKIITISTDLAISNSMSSFVPKYWLTGKFWWPFLLNFEDKDGTTKVYILVNPWPNYICP